jgi:hypothetical protein
MANTLEVIDYITKETLRIGHEKSTFLGTIDRQYDAEFGKKGMKAGDTIRIRKPEQGTIRTGRVANVQDSEETHTTLTVSTQKGFELAFNSAEAALSLDDYIKRKIEPRMGALISNIEAEVLQGATKQVYQVAGTAGTPVASLAAFGAARAKLNQSLAPKDGRCIQLDSVTMGGLVDALKGDNRPDADTTKAFREGFYTRTAMADFYENERIWSMANSAGTTPVNANDTIADAATTLTVQTTTTAWAIGQVFTVAGIYDVHPETKAAYPHLKQFTIRATSTATVLQISPTIYITGAKKNVATSTGADISGAQSGAVTLVGAASTNYVQNLMYHPEFCTFATADLPLRGGADRCVMQNHEGLALRVWEDSDIINDEQILRVDILYGWSVLKPEWACRVTN